MVTEIFSANKVQLFSAWAGGAGVTADVYILRCDGSWMIQYKPFLLSVWNDFKTALSAIR